MALKKEDVLLHSEDHIIHSLELQHAKFISKHISKVTGKMVYVYGKAKDAAGNLLDKDATETRSETKSENNKTLDTGDIIGERPGQQLEALSRLGSKKSDSNTDRSKSKLKSFKSDVADYDPGSNSFHKTDRKTSAKYNVRKKGTIHKAYDGTLSSIAKLFK